MSDNPWLIYEFIDTRVGLSKNVCVLSVSVYVCFQALCVPLCYLFFVASPSYIAHPYGGCSKELKNFPTNQNAERTPVFALLALVNKTRSAF